MANLSWEGLKQALYELGGRSVMVGVQAARGTAPVVGETIRGVKLPETTGQAYGKPGGFTQTVEHYLSRTFLGGPLKAVQEAQERASRLIMAKLSFVPSADPANLARNWAEAREATKAVANPMYDSLREVPASEASTVAKGLLEDESLHLFLAPKARQALTALAGAGKAKKATEITEGLLKGRGYKNIDEAIAAANAKGDLRSVRDWEALRETAGTQEGTVGGAIKARSELGDLARGTTDQNAKRLLWDAHNELNTAIDRALTPGQQAVKAEADKLWRRSYIIDDIYDNFQKMSLGQDPNQAPKILVNSFVKMVNDLREVPIGPAGPRPSQLEALFDNPVDRKAIVDLASFLSAKYSTMGGEAGLSESIARIGVALEAGSIPFSLMMGHPAVAATTAASMAGMYATAKVLANPGGAQALLRYFRSAPAQQAALATRLVGTTIEKAYPEVKVKIPTNRKEATDLMRPQVTTAEDYLKSIGVQ
jgi:hypothetical protein